MKDTWYRVLIGLGRKLWGSLLLFLAPLSMAVPSLAQNYQQSAELIPTFAFDALAGKMGASVAISGDGNTAVLGAPGYFVEFNFGPASNGAVYVWSKQGSQWVQSAKLIVTALDAAGQLMGTSVAVSYDGSVVVAGAPFADTQHPDHFPNPTPGGGATYVFVRPPGGWVDTNTYNAKLTNTDGNIDDDLGRSVSVSGDGSVVLAGAPQFGSYNSNPTGKAYVYVRPSAAQGGWGTSHAMHETSQLVSSNSALDDGFGQAVSLSFDGSVAAISAPFKSVIAGGTSVAYVFLEPSGQGWVSATSYTEAAQLVGSDSQVGAVFGSAIAISGDGSTIAIGADNITFPNNTGGELYVFVVPTTGWATPYLQTEAGRFTDPLNQRYDGFGDALAISFTGDRVVAGLDGGRPFTPGNVAVYKEPSTGWTVFSAGYTPVILSASEGAQPYSFGASVAIDFAGNLMIGSPDYGYLPSTNQQQEGAGYYFVSLPPPTVSVTATAQFNRVFGWDVKLNVDKTRVQQIGGNATFNFTSVETELGWNDGGFQVVGTISVSNPAMADITASASDVVTNGGGCFVAGPITVPADQTIYIPYSCSYGAPPVTPAGTSTATVTVGNLSVQASAPFVFGGPTYSLYQTVNYLESFAGTPPALLSTLTNNDVFPLINIFSVPSSHTVPVPASGCVKYPDEVDLAETGAFATQVVTVCGPARLGSVPLTFWLSISGRTLVVNAGSTAGACSFSKWLSQFPSFKLVPRGSCREAYEFVAGVSWLATQFPKLPIIQLVAQELTTGLNVYFSDPALGGNQLAAPAPIGSSLVDLTQVCTGVSGGVCSGYENDSTVFGGAASVTPLHMLQLTNVLKLNGSQQLLATHAFSAVNNQLAFAP